MCLMMYDIILKSYPYGIPSNEKENIEILNRNYGNIEIMLNSISYLKNKKNKKNLVE